MALVAEAIEGPPAVRGAPAIGIAAAYAIVPAAGKARVGAAGFARDGGGRRAPPRNTADGGQSRVGARPDGAGHPRRGRPISGGARRTARCGGAGDPSRGRRGLPRDRARGREARPDDGATVLTHCNAGALATGGIGGTALGVIRAARDEGKRVRVIACETRPLLQGAEPTAWELDRDGIDVTVITDSMVAQRLRGGDIDLAIVVRTGASRATATWRTRSGPTASPRLAQVHAVPFFVAAPWSTVDMKTPDGDAIPIERRGDHEVLGFAGVRTAPAGVRADNPAFDVTPARLVRTILTERGEVSPVGEAAMVRVHRGAC